MRNASQCMTCVHECFFKMLIGRCNGNSSDLWPLYKRHLLIIANLYMWCTDKQKRKANYYLQRQKIVCIHFHNAINLENKHTSHTNIFFSLHLFHILLNCHSCKCCTKNVKMLNNWILINTVVDLKKTPLDFVKKHCAFQMVIHVSRIALIYI